MRKKCSSDQEKILKFEAEGWEFAKFLRTICSNSERSDTILVTESFLTFFRYDKLEELEFKLEKIIGI